MEIIIESPEEKLLRQALSERPDAEAKRLTRLLELPDLSRRPDSPLYEIVKRTLQVKSLTEFDVIKIPEIVPTQITFDLFNMPPGHPARSKSDTYYVDEENILRPHDTVMWYYYLNQPKIKEKIGAQEPLGVICYGKVYRKDEIDRRHLNVFHQLGGLFLVPDNSKDFPAEKMADNLKQVLSKIAISIFGPAVEFRFYDHHFPYTDPSFEMEAKINDQWIELLGSGLPRKSVLENFGLTGYHGWAFGFGLERLAIASMELPDIRLLWSEDERVKRQLKLGQKYEMVSKYPAIVRDISFIVANDFAPNNYYDLIRDLGGAMVEEVTLLDKYENAEKFGAARVSYTYRITYRSLDRTLTATEIEPLQQKITAATIHQFQATVR